MLVLYMSSKTYSYFLAKLEQSLSSCERHDWLVPHHWPLLLSEIVKVRVLKPFMAV